ncbi:MAG: SdrD B-like domain-containing protein, partial [Sarcina sp.]
IGYTFTKKNIGIDETKNSKVNENTGKTDNITLKQNFQNLNINAGLIKLATLGGTVWLDRNNNGIQEIGELGIKDITVILYYCNDIIKSLYTSITDSNGKYIIENILPGNYYAKFVEPIGYKFVTIGNLVNSTGKSNCLTLTVGEERLNIDAPLIDIKSLLVEKSVNLTQAEIGDELTYTIKIFNNGVETVQNLKLSDKIPNGTTLVNNSFTLKNEIIPNVDLSNDLNIGKIQAKETIIITFKVKIEDTIPIPNPIQNKAIIKFEDGEEETLPVITTVVKSSLGNFVWHDLNGNGIQDLNEQGIENINIILYNSNELNIPLKTTTTNENGFYLFDNLRAGEYTIEFIKPIGYTFTKKNAGSNNTKNSKANISTGKTDNIILEKNIQNLNIDAA